MITGRDIRDCSAQQMATISYLKRTLEGNAFWQGTISLSSQDIQMSFDSETSNLRKAKTYLVFCASLGIVLDKKSLQLLDYTRAIALITQEVDNYMSKDDLPVASISQYNRKETKKKSMFARASEEYTLLHIPHFAFAPDYSQSVRTLLETLRDVYSRLLAYLVQPTTSTRDLGPAILESFHKFDTKTKKVLSSISRDLELVARDKVNRELEGLLYHLQM